MQVSLVFCPKTVLIITSHTSLENFKVCVANSLVGERMRARTPICLERRREGVEGGRGRGERGRWSGGS